MDKIQLKKQSKSFQETIKLASSKSESNRALIINALCDFKGELENLASARDTQTMIRLLNEGGPVADVLDAGTTMRFLTAYFSVKGIEKTMTGTPRMQERPIGILVDALRSIGVDITYLKTEGYPPHKINGFEKQQNDTISIRGDVSSQYISALCMIAPLLPKGLTIQLTGELGSIPYITMTLALMEAFGVKVMADWEQKLLKIAPQKYQATKFQVESDWSGASYWYSIVALSPFENTRIKLLGLKENSLQGDSAIAAIMDTLGVKSDFESDGVVLTKKNAEKELKWDFTNCPDLAQTVAVTCVMKGITAYFTGIESLKIKETDRVLALQNELEKLGGALEEIENNHLYKIEKLREIETMPVIDTYDDHRMAMAFAPVCMLHDVEITEPMVVVKSYPEFWDDLMKVAETI